MYHHCIKYEDKFRVQENPGHGAEERLRKVHGTNAKLTVGPFSPLYPLLFEARDDGKALDQDSWWKRLMGTVDGNA